jgi:hypothetical protein
MASLAFMAPLLPDGADRLQELAAALAGPRLAETTALHRRLGVSAEHWYRQATAQGDVVIVYLEGHDLPHTFQALASSQAPFDVWFKAQAKAVHGIDFSQPPQAPLPTQLYRWSAR